MRTAARRTAIAERVRAVLGEHPVVAVDVGARGDLPEPWVALDGIAEFISFEPDPAACAALEETYAKRGNGNRYRVVPHALTRDGGERTLYMTRARGGTSLFDPDVPLLRQYINREYLYPITTETIQTVAARDVMAELGDPDVDFMKLDIQGCELEVLEGLAGGCLDRVIGVELEASMQPREAGYPSFTEIHEFMLAQGFELFDLWPDYTHRTLDGSRQAYLGGMLKVRTASHSVAARIWEADLIYFRPAEHFLADGMTDKLRKLLVGYCLYGFFVEALDAVDRARRAKWLEPDDAAALEEAVLQWHREIRCRPWHGTGLVGDLAESLMRRLGLPAFVSPADYIHRR